MARQGRAGVALFCDHNNIFFRRIICNSVTYVFRSNTCEILRLDSGLLNISRLWVLGLVAASTIGIGVASQRANDGRLWSNSWSQLEPDVSTGVERYTFDFFHLHDGISLVALAMGIFGISEVLASIGQNVPSMPKKLGLSNMLPTRDDVRRCGLPTVRGTLIGSAVGISPGFWPVNCYIYVLCG